MLAVMLVISHEAYFCPVHPTSETAAPLYALASLPSAAGAPPAAPQEASSVQSQHGVRSTNDSVIKSTNFKVVCVHA